MYAHDPVFVVFVSATDLISTHVHTRAHTYTRFLFRRSLSFDVFMCCRARV
ncbi:MAG: hypothetical protein ACK55Z_11360 [bacterium]